MKRAVLITLFAASLLSCSDAAGPVATASATVIRVTTSGSGSVDATLDVALTNQTSMDIQLAPCGGASLEKQNASGEWDQVWSAACFTISHDNAIIPAGTSITLTQRITAQGNGDTWPGVGLDGTYRLRYYVFPSDALMKRIARVTNLIAGTPVVSNEFEFPAS